MNKQRVSIINYQNTIPFQYGLKQSPELIAQTNFLYHYPSQGVELLKSDKIDIGILPIASIPHIPNAHIVSKYCIGSKNKVRSVCICSNKPFHEIQTITLDYQSMTSNALTKIIAHEIWKISPNFVMGNKGYETATDNSAKVIIGDRALQLQDQFAYCYDLAEEWNNAFNLPFVFACWVANKPIPENYLLLFENALEYGITHINESIESRQEKFSYDIYSYLHTNLDFELTDSKKQSMQLFWEKAQKYQ